jgi:glyceraldehyde 3-phosphate dehydrogenase
MKKVAINGLGRIGRALLKLVLDEAELELVAINDLIPAENLAYLLRYDSVYGTYSRAVTGGEGVLVIDGREYPLLSEKEPAELPWAELDVDIVFECTGLFRTRDALQGHLKAGAKRVVLSAPAKDDEIMSVVHGVNTPDQPPDMLDCASCTTNCITPVVEVIGRRFGIRKATMTTIHAYTSTQGLVDGAAGTFRRGRAAACNLVPTSTGAAKATTRALPEYAGKLDGAAIRVPVPCGSIADMVFLVERKTDAEGVNAVLSEEADTERYRGILGVTKEPLVSSDILRDTRASIVDSSMTQVIDGDLVKIMSWYDNEWGYASQMIRMVRM